MTTPRLAAMTVAGTLANLGIAVLGWAGLAGFLSHPARTALTIVLCTLAVAALSTEGNINLRAGRPQQPMGPGCVRRARNARRLSAGVARPQRGLDPRRRCTALDWRRSVRHRRRVAPPASLCVGPTVQRPRRDPTRPSPRHQRHLSRDTTPELSLAFDQFARLGTGISFGCRIAADGADGPAAAGANSRRRGATRFGVRHGLQRLSRPHHAADPGIY